MYIVKCFLVIVLQYTHKITCVACLVNVSLGFTLSVATLMPYANNSIAVLEHQARSLY